MFYAHGSKMWTSAKVISLVVIFSVSFLSGITSCILVLCLRRKYGISGLFKRIIGLLNCFAGGVFFATSILHLLPEAREKVEETLELWGKETEYPITEALTGTGFLLILTFENVAHACCSVQKEQQTYETVTTGTCENKTQQSKETHCNNGTYNSYSGVSETSAEKSKLGSDSVSYTTESKPAAKIEFQGNNVSAEYTHDNGDTLSKTKCVDTVRNPLEAERDWSTNGSTVSKVRAIVLMVALSFHMVFEGLALGLLDRDIEVWTLLLALCLHKILVFMSIGLETYELFKSICKCASILLCFAANSPIGIIIGVSVSSSGDALSQSASAGVLQSVSTGTFLYITFFEIFHREFEGSTPDLLKVVCAVVGFAIAGAVKLLEGIDL